MNKRLPVILILCLLLALCAGARADTEFALENEYALTLPDGWIADAPSDIAAADTHGDERAVQTLYADSDRAGGYRIDVYAGRSDLLADADMTSFHARLLVHEKLHEYFSGYTDSFWIMGQTLSDTGVALFMNYVYDPDDEYLMAFTFRDDAYTGFVFYNLADARGKTVPLTDGDCAWFERVMKGLRAL